MDRVHLLQLRDQLRGELATHEKLAETLRNGLAAIEVLLERPAPATPEPAPAMPAVTEASPVIPNPQPAGDATTSPDSTIVAPEPEASDGVPPVGSEAVERLLVENPGRWFGVRELTARQIERGWTPKSADPVSAVRAAANRLVASKPNLFVREQGRYRYQGQQSSLNGDGPETVKVQASASPADQQQAIADRQTGGDWRNLARTEAVARMLAVIGEPASPVNLSRMLKGVGRDDPPLAVGKALDHLKRRNRATTVGRGGWVLTDRGDPKTSLPTNDLTEETEVNDDQEMSPAVLAFTGDSRQPDKFPDQPT